MKHITSLLFLTMIACTLFAQAPNKFRYQAVARDQSGSVITGKMTPMGLSLMQKHMK